MVALLALLAVVLSEGSGIRTKVIVDKEKARQSWTNLVKNAMSREKVGARVFVSTSLFFRLGLAKEVSYQPILPLYWAMTSD